jgi:hypothetical protein
MFRRRRKAAETDEQELREGRVPLWDGWSLSLPAPCRVVRNEDDSWSAFDASRAVDVDIVTFGGTTDGVPIPAETMLRAPDEAPVREANGCLSYAEMRFPADDPGVRVPERQGRRRDDRVLPVGRLPGRGRHRLGHAGVGLADARGMSAVPVTPPG